MNSIFGYFEVKFPASDTFITWRYIECEAWVVLVSKSFMNLHLTATNFEDIHADVCLYYRKTAKYTEEAEIDAKNCETIANFD